MKKIALLLLIYSALPSFGAEGPKPYDPTVGEGFVNPVGYSLEDLSFSWKLPLERKGISQTAYRIRVATSPKNLDSPDVWDSGKVESSQSVAVPYGGRAVKSGERLWWNVSVWDENGNEGAPSDPSFFEAGLLSNSDWKGKWIYRDFPPNCTRKYQSHKGVGIFEYRSPVYLRKDFKTAAKKIEKARLYATARGAYQVYLNGKKVGDDFWSPGWTDYNKRIQTTTYDVTNMLSASDANTLGAVVADGWYSGRLAWKLSEGKGFYGKIPEFLAQLEIVYSDGTKEIICTDETWKAGLGGILNSDLYDGEEFDARREPIGWNAPDFDDSAWKEVSTKPVENTPSLDPRRNQPIVIKDTLTPISVKEISPGTYIFDIGQNMVGWAKIKIDGQSGQKIKIRFAEMLNDDGTLYVENYRTARSTDYYTCAGGKAEWEPNFTYHGFRYVELSGLPAGEKIPLDSVEGRVLFNDMPLIGSFICSEPKINQLQSNIQWGQRSNFFSVPTDCPQRDERLGWTGDIQVFAPTAAFNMDVNAFMTKWLVDLDDARSTGNSVPKYAPVLNDKLQGGPAWGDAATLCPWEIYLSYGNPKILRNTFEMMKRHVDHCVSISKDYVYPDYGYGDWLEPFSEDRRGTTPRSLIGTAFTARSAEVTAKTAKIIGRKNEAKKYEEIAQKAKEAFVKNFVDLETGKVKSGNQTAYLLALSFDLLPENIRPKAFENLKDSIKRSNYHIGTGFVGTPLINPTLSRYGDYALAMRLLKNETYPSWLYPINQGATTMWERWNSYTKDKGFGDVSMNSFNHYAYGAIGKWMYSEVGGLALDPKQPGYKNIIFAPKPDKTMRYASAKHITPYGEAASIWKYTDGVLEWKVTIPANATGTIVFPTKNLDSIRFDGHPLSAKVEMDEHGYPVLNNVKSGDYQILLRI